MNAIAQLGTEDVVHEPVLSEPGQAPKCGRADDRVEVMTVAAHGGDGAGNPGLDP